MFVIATFLPVRKFDAVGYGSIIVIVVIVLMMAIRIPILRITLEERKCDFYRSNPSTPAHNHPLHNSPHPYIHSPTHPYKTQTPKLN